MDWNKDSRNQKNLRKIVLKYLSSGYNTCTIWELSEDIEEKVRKKEVFLLNIITAVPATSHTHNNRFNGF